LIDGVILATARAKGQKLVTLDGEFLGFDDVVLLAEP
jgi:predicted nucleic acid-binding protein